MDDNFNFAKPLRYCGSGEYIINIPARDLTVMEVIESAYKMDMAIGAMVVMLTAEATTKHGEALYTVIEPPKKVTKQKPKPEKESEESNG